MGPDCLKRLSADDIGRPRVNNQFEVASIWLET